MIVLEALNLRKSFGERTLFENLSLSIEKGKKLALVARNGTGKTSLLNILAGLEEPDKGEVNVPKGVRIGYLPQLPVLPENQSIIQTVLEADNPMNRAIEAYERALKNPMQGDDLQKAIDQMDSTGAWDYETQVKETLGRLEIHDLERKCGKLSGGQQKRVALAKIVLQEPDLFIMDEPTNHLDLDMVEWLEGFLNQARVSLLLVTHDRYFLDRITDEIIEVRDQQLFKYKGNYAYYLEKKTSQEEIESTESSKAKKLYTKELDWLRRQPKARGTKSKSRIDAAGELKKKGQQQFGEDKVDLDVNMQRLGKKIIELHNLKLAYDETVILDGFSYNFSRGEKVGIVGKNGAGKSSFLNLISEDIKPDSGHITYGETVKIGYYRQQLPEFKAGKRVIEVVQDIAEYIDLGGGQKLTAAQLLERFLFDRKEQYNYVEKLSGGEKRRLYLLTVLMANPNFLILDEPTNDLDILTLTVLEEFLENFKGCLLLVTHDRYFLDKLADHLLVFEGNGEIVDYIGKYHEYRAKRKTEEQEKLREVRAEVEASKKKAKPEKPTNQNQRKLNYKEKREKEELELEISEIQEKIAGIEKQLNSGEGSHEEMAEWGNSIQELKKTQDEKELRWLELSEIEE